jgi:predicted GIY-YIG superfamily endonuclease
MEYICRNGKKAIIHGDIDTQSPVYLVLDESKRHRYIGETDRGLLSRVDEHLLGNDSHLLKTKVLSKSNVIHVFVLKKCSSKQEAVSEQNKLIHEHCARIFKGVTGLDIECDNYSRYANIVQPWILNEVLF